MSKELKFERETCSRCGGTGHYSYNQISGSTCFKCHGHREVLTARGAAAHAWLKAKWAMPARDVLPGMVIMWAGNTYNVQSVAWDLKSSSKSRSLPTDPWVDAPPAVRIEGVKHGCVLQPDTEVQLKPPAAQRLADLAAAIEYQNSLTKAGTVRKR